MLVLLVYSSQETGYAREKENIDYAFILHYECSGGPTEKNLTAYWDHKGYSIGCGTPSYKGEHITKAEALRRFYEYTDIRVLMVKRNFPKISAYQLTALVSLAANNGTCYSFFRKGDLSEWEWREKCDNVKKDGKLIELRGLHLRRNAEADLYY